MSENKLAFIKDYSSRYYKLGLFLVTLVICSAAIFTVSIKTLLSEEVEVTLSEVTTQGAAFIDERIANTLDSIVTISIFDVISDPGVDVTEKVAKLKPEVARKGFVRMGIADLNGNSLTTDGLNANISHRDYFKKSLNNELVLSDVLVDLNNDKEFVVVYSAPIFRDGNIVGVLFAVDEKNKLNQLLEQIYYSGRANSYLINSDMEVLMTSEQVVIPPHTSLFSIVNDYSAGSTDKIKSDITKQKNGVGSYIYKNDKKFVGYSRIKNTDNWYMFISSPEEVVLERADKITNLVITLLLSLSLVFIFLIYHTNKMNTQFVKELAENEERYRIINEHTNDIIIDWDLKNKFIFTTTAWKDIFGFQLEVFPDDSFNLENIYPEDNVLLADGIKTLLDGSSPAPIDIRLKDKNDNYLWFNFTMVGIFDEQIPTRIISVLKDINDAKVRQNLLKTKAEYDPLSKLFNRATFEENAQEEIKIAKILMKRLAFIFVDIDDFRFFNNNFGHAFGDRVISFIGGNLKKHVEGKGFAGRNGGDEFIMCINKDSVVDDIENFVLTLMSDLKQGIPVREDTNNTPVGCSIGIVFYPDLTDNYDDLVKNADAGMYQAKKSGKGTYTIITKMEV